MKNTTNQISRTLWSFLFIVIVITGCSSQVTDDSTENPIVAPLSTEEEYKQTEPETVLPVVGTSDSGSQRSLSNAPSYIVYPTRQDLFVSLDSGATWTSSRPLDEFNTSLYITAAAINPQNADHIVVASSYQGFYQTRDGGESWERLRHNSIDRVLYQGAQFYDEVNALWIPQTNPDTMLFRKGFSDQWYRWNNRNMTVTPIDDPTTLPGTYSDLPLVLLTNLDLSPDRTDIWTQRKLPLYDQTWPLPPDVKSGKIGPLGNTLELTDEFWERRALASDKTGIYLNPWQAANNLDAHLQFVLDHGMNSIIVDFKDDIGYLTYDSQLEITRQVGAINVRFDAKELIRKAHEKNIYVIARHVVFKDRQLYRYLNGKYALWDITTNRPWGVFRRETPAATEENPNPESRTIQIEYWVDPYADFVAQYNIAIAQELQDLGVDEVQFDYIRFPSDGLTRNIRSRFYTIKESQIPPEGYQEQTGPGEMLVHPEILVLPGWPQPVSPAQDGIPDRVWALQNFLRKAREVIEVPISTDIFGFNAWARMGYLGQDIEAFSFYVDVISPMAYPSHYARDFLPQLTYFQRAYELYDTGTYRARSMAGDRVLIRPYVQAFLIGGELRYEYPEYTEYLNLQIRGTMQGGGSGFSLWNNSGRYYMVDRDSFLDSWTR